MAVDGVVVVKTEGLVEGKKDTGHVQPSSAPVVSVNKNVAVVAVVVVVEVVVEVVVVVVTSVMA